MKRAISSVGSEHLVYTQRVGGSNPSSPTKVPKTFKNLGLLAQLVQSIWFTPRGSGVRIPQGPQKLSDFLRVFYFNAILIF
ncbi:hypothetical protein CHRYSEO8AT_540136 [Chryseobacterium sp. 8AT]|nr:hypothetical protein CHRYSEO8AT_540136 [Chryseobacterium sp. 8AT]